MRHTEQSSQYSVKNPSGNTEIAQWLRAWAALAEDEGSISSTYIIAYKHPELQSQEIGCPLLVSADTRH